MPKKAIKAVGSPVPAPLLVDIPTAAKMLSSTVWQIRTLVWAKKLPVIKLGNKFLFRPADLEEFVRKQAGE